MELINFLIEFKQIVTSGRGLDIIPRSKNNKTILELGLTRQNVRALILELTREDYVSGPDLDRDQPGEIWVFGKQVAGKEIYIKLKIARTGTEQIAKCISFHYAEYPLRYPNKRS